MNAYKFRFCSALRYLQYLLFFLLLHLYYLLPRISVVFAILFVDESMPFLLPALFSLITILREQIYPYIVFVFFLQTLVPNWYGSYTFVFCLYTWVCSTILHFFLLPSFICAELFHHVYTCILLCHTLRI